MEMGWIRRSKGKNSSGRLDYGIEFLKASDLSVAGIQNTQPDWYGTQRNEEKELISIVQLTLEENEKYASAKRDMKLLALIREKLQQLKI